MNIKYSHGRELLTDAIKILSTGQKDLRFRLYQVYRRTSHLQYSELPEKTWEDWKYIQKQFNIYEVHKKFADKYFNFRNKTGEKIADKVWRIYYVLHFNEENN